MASIVNWFKKHIEQPVEHFVSNDVAQPVAHAVSNVGHAAGNVVHAAAPSTIENRVVQPVVQHVAKPIFNFPQTVNNDVFKPIQRDVFKPAVNVAQGIASPFEYLAKADIINPTRQLAAQFTHNNVAARNAQLATNRNLGLGDNGTDFTGGLRKWAGNTAQIGLDVAAPGVGKAIDRSFTSVAPKVVPKLATRAVANAGTGAVLGAPFNTAAVVANPDIPLTKQNLVRSGLQGAQAGAVLGGAGTIATRVAPAAARTLSKQLHSLPDKIRTNSLDIVTNDVQAKPTPIGKLTSYEGAPDKARVNFYKQQVLSGKPIKPIVAIRDSAGNLGIEDGKHRYQAYKELGIKRIPTKVTTWEQIKAKREGGYVRVPGAGKNASEGMTNSAGGETPIAPNENARASKAASPENPGPSSISSDASQAASQQYHQLNRTQPLRLPQTTKGLSETSLPSRGSGEDLSSKNSVALNNQAHAEAKTPSPNDIGRALGLSDKQMAAANRAEREQQQVSQGLSSHLPLKEASEPKTPVTSSEALPKNRQNPSARKVSSVKSGSSGSKYTTNATKVNIADVKPGDYEKVRSNAQLVQTVVHNHAQSVIHALRKLPDKERANFWHSVENPKLSRSPEMQTAIDRWHRLADTVHATSKSLGGDTPYLANYARHNWDLSDPAQRDLYEQLLKQKVSDTNYNPDMFRGLDNKPRLFSTIKEGQVAGFKLKNANPIDDIVDYASKSKRLLKTQAVAKGMQEAEENIPLADKSETQTIGYKKSIETTKQGVRELRALFPPEKSTNKALKGYRALNHGAKRFLLGISQFHPVNINMQAAPALALRGHPIRAVRGLIDSAAALNKKYSDKIMENALKDGTLEDAGRIGTPIATGSDFATGNKVDLKAGFGERAVFERQLPAMHIQMVRGVVSDLKKRGISLDSPEARKAGTEINQIMGYVNTELRNLSPTVQRGLGDVALAPQFTRSKWEVLGDAFNPKNAGTLQGKYARDAVVGKYLAEAGITLALGALLGQKSDNIKDTLIRTLIHPAVPTPFKDKKGNTIELGLPQNYVSEAAGLGLNYSRGANGHLNISASPSGIPGNLNQYGKNRLALVPNDALKVVTNTDFADKPLYDPNASTGTKIAQGATTLLTGHLPIGAQGLAYTSALNKHLPKSIQEVLNNASPGSNPILKSVGSSFGLNPRTDKTVGKGLSTSRYFDALDNAKKGLNSRELAAIVMNTDSKKNPVTGKYDVTPNVNDSRAKATALLDQPKAFNALYNMNQKLAKEGEKVDPLWQQSAARVKSYLAYQAMAPGSADKSDWYNKNKSWYQPVAAARSTFFNNLPPGDPNKPQLASQFSYPTKPKAVNDYYNLKSSNPTAANAFFDNHPEIAKYEDQYAQVTNNWRTAQGYAPFKNYPKASPDVQSFMDNYNAADKATRKSIRNSNPTQYRKMIAYYDALDLYNINKQGALGQLQGEPDYTDKSAKAIKNIGEDFYVDQNGNYHLIPAGWMLGIGGSGYGGSAQTPEEAAFKSALRQLSPLKIVGALPAPSVASMPKFKTPALRTVYQKKGVNTHPTSSLTKTKR